MRFLKFYKFLFVSLLLMPLVSYTMRQHNENNEKIAHLRGALATAENREVISEVRLGLVSYCSSIETLVFADGETPATVFAKGWKEDTDENYKRYYEVFNTLMFVVYKQQNCEGETFFSIVHKDGKIKAAVDYIFFLIRRGFELAEHEKKLLNKKIADGRVLFNECVKKVCKNFKDQVEDCYNRGLVKTRFNAFELLYRKDLKESLSELFNFFIVHDFDCTVRDCEGNSPMRLLCLYENSYLKKSHEKKRGISKNWMPVSWLDKLNGVKDRLNKYLYKEGTRHKFTRCFDILCENDQQRSKLGCFLYDFTKFNDFDEYLTDIRERGYRTGRYLEDAFVYAFVDVAQCVNVIPALVDKHIFSMVRPDCDKKSYSDKLKELSNLFYGWRKSLLERNGKKNTQVDLAKIRRVNNLSDLHIVTHI